MTEEAAVNEMLRLMFGTEAQAAEIGTAPEGTAPREPGPLRLSVEAITTHGGEETMALRE